MFRGRVGHPRAGLQRGEERLRQLVDGEPDRVVEEWVSPDGVHGGEHQFGGFGGGELRQRAHGLHADTRVRVGDEFGEAGDGVALGEVRAGVREISAGRAVGVRDEHGLRGHRGDEAQRAHGGGADAAVLGTEQLSNQLGRGDVEGLVNPQRGELLLLVLELRGPRLQLRSDGGGTLLHEQAGGLGGVEVIGRKQFVQQRRGAGLCQRHGLRSRLALHRHAPDAAVLAVAARVAEVHFAVVDDGVAPVGDVERAVGAELHVNRAEGVVRGAADVRLLLGDVARALVGDAERSHAVRAEVARHHAALPVGGEVRAADDFEAGELRVAAGTDAAEDAPGARVGLIHRAGQAPVDARAARAVGHEALAELVELMAPTVHPALEDDLELLRRRLEAEHAARAQAHDAVGRLDFAAGVDGLAHPEAAVRAPTERVEIVVRVLGAEAGEDDAAHVGLAVAVGVLQVQQLGALRDIHAAVAGREAGGDEHVLGEDGGFVGFARALGVFEDDDFVVRGLAGFDLRIDLAAGDPEAALRVEVDLDGLGEVRVLSPERDFETFRHGELGRGLRCVLGGGGLPEQRGGLEFGTWLEAGVVQVLAQLANLLLLGGDERVELRHLDGVLALLAFPEAEDVSHVRRAGAVEEELVFAEDDLAECRARRIELRERKPRHSVLSLGVPELDLNVRGNPPIHLFRKVNAILRPTAVLMRSGSVFLEAVEKGDGNDVSGLRDFTDNLRVNF